MTAETKINIEKIAAIVNKTGVITRQSLLAKIREELNVKHGEDSALLSISISQGYLSEYVEEGEIFVETPGKAWL